MGINRDLKDYCKIGLALTIGAAVAYGLEQTGIPEFLYDYELAKAAVTKQFYGEFMGTIQTWMAPESARVGVDMIAGTLGSLLDYRGIEKLCDFFKKKEYN